MLLWVVECRAPDSAQTRALAGGGRSGPPPCPLPRGGPSPPPWPLAQCPLVLRCTRTRGQRHAELRSPVCALSLPRRPASLLGWGPPPAHPRRRGWAAPHPTLGGRPAEFCPQHVPSGARLRALARLLRPRPAGPSSGAASSSSALPSHRRVTTSQCMCCFAELPARGRAATPRALGRAAAGLPLGPEPTPSFQSPGRRCRVPRGMSGGQSSGMDQARPSLTIPRVHLRVMHIKSLYWTMNVFAPS